MKILGINTYHGDASAALIVGGRLVAAAEEERFTRVKHDTSFPASAIRYCLAEANLKPEEIGHIALSRDPRAHLTTRTAFALGTRAGRRMAPQRLRSIASTLKAKRTLAEELGADPRTFKAQTHFVEHHVSHLASSFYVSPFERAAVLSIDGFGDMVSAMWGVGEGTRLNLRGHVGFPDSLGVFYTAVTQYLGFNSFGDEYKVMGLAAYGEPAYLEEMRRMVTADGLTYKLNLEYFRHHRDGSNMTWAGGYPELGPLWGEGMVRRLGPARVGKEEPLEKRHHDIAASLQLRLEEIVLPMICRLHEQTGLDDLCLSGGVALNCVVNGKIFKETPFRRLYVQPASNDAGTAIGAALQVHHELGGERRHVMDHAYLGPGFTEDHCRRALKSAGIAYETVDDAVERTAKALADGAIVGWFQGRMEFGPRALGNRSILADPRRADMKDILNARIKHREPFRPFAPSIVEEAVGDYFEETHPSPFMTLSYPVRPEKRDQIPAPIHVDGTGRLQTVSKAQNPRYHQLISEFGRRTGVPVLLNTSFNDNEPICCTPEQAVETFKRTRMDVLVLGDLYAVKE